MSDNTTKLIERIEKAMPKASAIVPVGFTHDDCRTLTLALRVLRVLRHPLCVEAHISPTGKLVFRLMDNPTPRRLLDDAERILGIVDGDA